MTIVLQFHGGFKDGLVLRSDSKNGYEVQEAFNYFKMTEDGTVGKRFCAISDAGFAEIQNLIVSDSNGVRLKHPPSTSMNHVYEVASREQIEGEIIVRFEYQGQSD